MSGTPFRAPAALAELPKGAERAIIDKFRQIEAALTGVQVIQRNATAVMNTAAYMAKPGELVLIEGRAGGTLVTIPPGSSANIEQTIRVALVGGVLSPGITIAIIGRKGTIDGAATVTITSRLLLELTSVGERGWTATCCGGGGGGGEDLAATLVLGNATGGTDMDFTGGSELRMAADPGAAGEVLTSGGPGVSPTWAPAGGGGAGWDDVLAVDNNSGANNPHIDTGQFLGFGVEGSLPASGQLRSSANFTANITGIATVQGSTNAFLIGTAGAAYFAIISGAAHVRTNSTNRLVIGTAGGWTINATEGVLGNVLTSQGAGATPQWAAPAAAAIAFLSTEINLGAVPQLSGSFTIAGAGMTIGKPVLIQQAVGPYTGKGSLADECEDQVTVSASVTSAVLITAYWSATASPIAGNVKFNYFVGA